MNNQSESRSCPLETSPLQKKNAGTDCGETQCRITKNNQGPGMEPGGQRVPQNSMLNSGSRVKPLTTNNGGREKPPTNMNTKNADPGKSGSICRGGLAVTYGDIPGETRSTHRGISAAVRGDLPGETRSTHRGMSAAVREEGGAETLRSRCQLMPDSGCVPKTGRGLAARARAPRSGGCVFIHAFQA